MRRCWGHGIPGLLHENAFNRDRAHDGGYSCRARLPDPYGFRRCGVDFHLPPHTDTYWRFDIGDVRCDTTRSGRRRWSSASNRANSYPALKDLYGFTLSRPSLCKFELREML